MSEAFLKLGAEVFICGRRGDVLKETADELMGRHGGHVGTVPCDIRNAEAVHGDDCVRGACYVCAVVAADARSTRAGECWTVARWHAA